MVFGAPNGSGVICRTVPPISATPKFLSWLTRGESDSAEILPKRVRICVRLGDRSFPISRAPVLRRHGLTYFDFLHSEPQPCCFWCSRIADLASSFRLRATSICSSRWNPFPPLRPQFEPTACASIQKPPAGIGRSGDTVLRRRSAWGPPRGYHLHSTCHDVRFSPKSVRKLDTRPKHRVQPGKAAPAVGRRNRTAWRSTLAFPGFDSFEQSKDSFIRSPKLSLADKLHALLKMSRVSGHGHIWHF